MELSKEQCLNTVRALHQTVVALRTALEESRCEILELKNKSWPAAGNKKAGVKRGRQRPPQFEAQISIKSSSLDSLTVLKPRCGNSRHFKFDKTVSFTNLVLAKIDRQFVVDEMNGNDDAVRHQVDEHDGISEDQDQVDDIELIFVTTDDTKEADFKEQLVSIEGDGESHLDQNLDISDRELDDDVFNDNNAMMAEMETFDFRRENSIQSTMCNSKSDNSINREEKSSKSCYDGSYRDSMSFDNKSLEKDESFDRFEERIGCVETDISKCGIQDDHMIVGRRNTCPNPLQYRPLLHRETLSKGRNGKSRPIRAHNSNNANRKECGAQTDISALPGSAWLSESNLVVNKGHVGDFTTLPSKFPMPGSRLLRLSEKTTVEARRVLLSDIGFTSMVPELSRSADHLCPPADSATTSYGQFLQAGDRDDQCQRFKWPTTAPPSDYTTTTTSAPLPQSFRRCSAPVSPSRKSLTKAAAGASRVRFANGSLPELRAVSTDWTSTTLMMDSGDSTDSLVDEAENYLRRSIDCILTSRENYERTKRSSSSSSSSSVVRRRASAPESSGDNVPPQGWQPFLPRVARDLKPDHWVKVITAEGRVRGGRVRYVGAIINQIDQFVGVQLATPEGHSDGTFNGRRYFQCEPHHGIFVPFKKVIMGWRP